MEKGWTKLIQRRKWLISLEDKIDDYVERGDSINVWGIPSIGTSSQLRKLTKSTKSKTEFAYVDTQWLSTVTPDSFYDLLNERLLEQIDIETDDSVYVTPLLKTQRLIKEITDKNELCIIVDSLDELTELGNTFFSSTKALRDRFFGNLCFLFVSNRPLYNYPEFEKHEEFLDFACHKEIVSDPFTNEFISKSLPPILEEFNLELSEKEQECIVHLCGGSLGILKNILRIVEHDREFDLTEKNLLQEQSISVRLDLICEILLQEEVDYLLKLAQNKPPQTKITPFLAKSGLIKKGKIRSSLLALAILEGCGTKAYKTKGSSKGYTIEDAPTEQKKGISIDIVSGEIHKNGKRLQGILSKSETRILQTMFEQPESVITRDEIAQQIWGDEHKDKYSEWAIDKAISRIRKKIGDTKKPHKYLITIKGKGFKFYPNP